MDTHTTPWNPATTPDFGVHELTCNCGHCDGRPYMEQMFMRRLQAMRVILGEPMVITAGGGYRCPLHPDRVARPGTYHRGMAADIAITDGSHRLRLVASAQGAGFTGLGFGRGFLHVDSRPPPEATSWTY